MPKPNTCVAIGCSQIIDRGETYCLEHKHAIPAEPASEQTQAEYEALVTPAEAPLSQRYPKYYKPVGELTEIDVYATHALFDIQDPSGAIQHASKKLLLSGVRTGGKSRRQDISEARDALNRWLELNTLGLVD